MSNSPAHRPSLADRVGMAIFSVAGLGIVVTAAVAAGYRIVGVPVSYTHLDVYKRQTLASLHQPPAMRILCNHYFGDCS